MQRLDSVIKELLYKDASLNVHLLKNIEVKSMQMEDAANLVSNNTAASYQAYVHLCANDLLHVPAFS